jgi:serine/threonine protein phosphatase PrpC
MLQSIRQLFAKSTTLHLETAGFSEIGQRDNLEDRYGYVQPNYTSGCWVVADGVGGQQAGEVAAQLAVDTLLQVFNESVDCQPTQLQTQVLNTHQVIMNARATQSISNNMASTVVVLHIDKQQAVWAHVGDSRLYWFRNGTLLERTQDQSLVNLLLARGALQAEHVAEFPQRHVILHALGHDIPPEVCVSAIRNLRAGDRFLLCSDGVWELLEESTLITTCFQHQSATAWLNTLQHLIANKIVAAGDSASADNYTAIAVYIT